MNDILTTEDLSGDDWKKIIFLMIWKIQVGEYSKK